MVANNDDDDDGDGDDDDDDDNDDDDSDHHYKEYDYNGDEQSVTTDYFIIQRQLPQPTTSMVRAYVGMVANNDDDGDGDDDDDSDHHYKEYDNNGDEQSVRPRKAATAYSQHGQRQPSPKAKKFIYLSLITYLMFI